MALSGALLTSLSHDYKNQLIFMIKLIQDRVRKSIFRPLRASYPMLMTLKETVRNRLFTSASLRFRQVSTNNNRHRYQTSTKIILSPVMNTVTVALWKVDHPGTQKASSVSLVGWKKECQSIQTVLKDQMVVIACLWCSRAWAVATKTIALPSQRYKNNNGSALVIKLFLIIWSLVVMNTALKIRPLPYRYKAKDKINLHPYLSKNCLSASQSKVQPLSAVASIHQISCKKQLEFRLFDNHYLDLAWRRNQTYKPRAYWVEADHRRRGWPFPWTTKCKYKRAIMWL